MILTKLWRSLRKDSDGAGAVEFAFIAPVLLTLYIGSFEVTSHISLANKVSRSAGAIGDIVTRQASVNTAFLATMVEATKANLAPYEPEDLTVRITGIRIDATVSPSVLWSWDQSGGRPYAPGEVMTDIPDDLLSPHSFIVKTEISMPHRMLFFLSSSVAMDARTLIISKTYFYRQRLGAQITCGNC